MTTWSEHQVEDGWPTRLVQFPPRSACVDTHVDSELLPPSWVVGAEGPLRSSCNRSGVRGVHGARRDDLPLRELQGESPPRSPAVGGFEDPCPLRRDRTRQVTVCRPWDSPYVEDVRVARVNGEPVSSRWRETSVQRGPRSASVRGSGATSLVRDVDVT